MIRVAVIDGHTVTRFGLFLLFTGQLDIKFLADASNVDAGRQLIAKHQPDVVTVAATLPDGDGLQLARELRDCYPNLGIVVLTSRGEDDVLFRALEAGASAFVARNAQTGEILAAVRHASVAAASFSATGLASAMARRDRFDVGHRLSPREHQVLELLGQGLSIVAIARQMYVSHSTAKTYVARIYEKLGASNRAQALMTAVREGLIEHRASLSA